MRFRVDVAATEPEMAWADVHGAARSVVYDLISAQDAELATQLHDTGWNNSPLRPVGIRPPVFPNATRVKGRYATAGAGLLQLSSPVPRVAACLLAGSAQRSQLRWGSSPLAVQGVQVAATPDHTGGEAVLETATPVVVKHDGRFLLPDDPGFTHRLEHNTARKADVLGLDNEVDITVLKSGPRRRFSTPKGFRIGARVSVRMAAAPPLLDAIHDWGLGLATNQGFGWIA
ncbi:CRISPR-associated endoribonuclease Cas6 [Haloactinospora alba]|uniref:CRISPR-associated endoribonuclease Cas6 n=1 Tax=Haloactinospora alba TaxID=405555 RepID=A0A543NEL7_9ACTN|nr:CRISPR-associated endoribonuclease Cas6 [Haloactinospora alba]TQN30265.1 CRISPR-associated endoribonuclease Cas6 [Haloactinospora alba]